MSKRTRLLVLFAYDNYIECVRPTTWITRVCDALLLWFVYLHAAALLTLVIRGIIRHYG